jgi:hypothetical protein
MKLTSKPLAAIVFVLFFGGIALTSVLGWFHTTTTKVPVTYAEGEFAGQYNPADIRGSYVFGDIASLFGVPLEDLQAAFRFPADVDPAAYAVKNLETQFADSGYEIGTEAVRLFVAFYKGLPYDLSGDTYLPLEAANILATRANLTPEQSAYLTAHTVDLSQPAAESAASATPAPAVAETSAAPQPVVSATEHVAADRTVTGKSTFQDLLDWGVAPAKIEAVIGAPMPSASMLIKDYLTSKGLEFSTVKGALQAEIDKAN